MNRTELLLDPESLLLLRNPSAARGRHGRPLHVRWDKRRRNLRCDGQGVSQHLRAADELDFEGDDDTYVRLRVREGAPERQSATKSGNLYSQNSGE